MVDFNMPEGGRCYPANSRVQMSSSSTKGTPGSWYELNSSTEIKADGFWVDMWFIGSRTMRIDIGVGGSGSEQVIVSGLPVNRYSTSVKQFHTVCPVQIPKGTRVAARVSNNQDTAVDQMWIQCHFYSLGLRGDSYQLRDSFGRTAVTASTGSYGSWTEVSSSCPANYRAIMIGVDLDGLGTMSEVAYNVEIGIGGSGSEIGMFQWKIRVDSVTDDIQQSMTDILPISLARGERIAFRTETNGTTDMTMGWHLWGFR